MAFDQDGNYIDDNFSPAQRALSTSYPEPSAEDAAMKPIDITGVGNRMMIERPGEKPIDEWGNKVAADTAQKIKANIGDAPISPSDMAFFGMKPPSEDELAAFDKWQQFQKHIEPVVTAKADKAREEALSRFDSSFTSVDMNLMSPAQKAAHNQQRNTIGESAYKGVQSHELSAAKNVFDMEYRKKAEQERDARNIERKSGPEGAKEELAQSLAKGDMTRIRDVMSLRSSGGAMAALEVFKRAREINPKFSTSEIERKIKMESDFTTGKDGQNLQSFGIFLEHAGAASAALDSIQSTQARLMNKPINYLKKNVTGDPNFQAFMVSLEPVRKEFESFLLGGRALYADDRKAAEIILSDDSSPEQVKSALKQMGHTAKARFSEMNYRYKKTMGHDLQEPFSQEAIQSAGRLGIDLLGEKGKNQQANSGMPQRTEYFTAMRRANPKASDKEINDYLDKKGVR